DQRVGRGRVAVEITVPALDTRIDEALHEIGFFARQLLRRFDQRAVARVARIGEQHDDRLYTFLFDDERLARQITLLDRLPVGEKRRGAERVGTDLVVGVAEFLLQELPARDPRVRADHDRLARQLGEVVIALAGVRDQYRRILLKNHRDR